ncbi:MAG TPA: hypothetical protein VFT22_11230 [Kofleriaceae bacterium]|nr:hypothetical protein [Kofleriaceae bacterium]
MIHHRLLVVVLLTSTAIAQPATPPAAEPDQPRASVIDAVVRADFQANARGVETHDHIVLGARYPLDVF